MSRRLKVLMSAYACEPHRGSEPEVGWQWAIHMARHHDVTVVTRANNREPIERGLATLPAPHPKFIYFDLSERMQSFKRSGMPVALYYFLWQRAVAKFVAPRLAEFDLIHHVTFNSFRQPGAWRACGKPIILGPLGGGQICPWRLLGDFGWAMPGELFRSLTVKLNALNPLARRSFRDATLILCANEDTAARMPKEFQSKVRMHLETGMNPVASGILPDIEPGILPGGKSVAGGGVLGSSVDSGGAHIQPGGMMPPSPSGKMPDATPNLIWVSRFVAIKGAPLVLRAFALALKKRPDLRLTMVGDGPDTTKVRRLAARLGLRTSIEWAGKVPLDKVKSLLPKHAAFVFTSLRDTSGNVLIEAMAAGLPAVIVRHHGAAMIATDETALRVPPTTAAETAARLADAMVQLASDAGLRARLGEAAARRINQIYAWPRKAEVMSAFYAETLA
jgi:glycosyltransferase involved in cell wall biosynthesis